MSSDDERDWQALCLLADLFLESGKPEKALCLLEGLDELRPGDEYVTRARAVASLRAGDPEAALRLTGDYERLADGESEHARAMHLLKAMALAAAGREGEAQAAAGRLLEGGEPGAG